MDGTNSRLTNLEKTIALRSINSETFTILQGLAPKLAIKDRLQVNKCFEDGSLLRGFDPSVRSAFKDVLYEQDSMVPSWSLFCAQKTALAKWSKWMRPLRDHKKTIDEKLSEIFLSNPFVEDFQYKIQTSPTTWRFVSVPCSDREELSRRQLWLFVMRQERDSPSGSDRQRLAQFAIQLGFDFPTSTTTSEDVSSPTASLHSVQNGQDSVLEALITSASLQGIVPPIGNGELSEATVEQRLGSGKDPKGREYQLKNARQGLFFDIAELLPTEGRSGHVDWLVVLACAYRAFMADPLSPSKYADTAGIHQTFKYLAPETSVNDSLVASVDHSTTASLTAESNTATERQDLYRTAEAHGPSERSNTNLPPDIFNEESRGGLEPQAECSMDQVPVSAGAVGSSPAVSESSQGSSDYEVCDRGQPPAYTSLAENEHEDLSTQTDLRHPMLAGLDQEDSADRVAEDVQSLSDEFLSCGSEPQADLQEEDMSPATPTSGGSTSVLPPTAHSAEHPQQSTIEIEIEKNCRQASSKPQETTAHEVVRRESIGNAPGGSEEFPEQAESVGRDSRPDPGRVKTIHNGTDQDTSYAVFKAELLLDPAKHYEDTTRLLDDHLSVDVEELLFDNLESGERPGASQGPSNIGKARGIETLATSVANLSPISPSRQRHQPVSESRTEKKDSYWEGWECRNSDGATNQADCKSDHEPDTENEGLSSTNLAGTDRTKVASPQTRTKSVELDEENFESHQGDSSNVRKEREPPLRDESVDTEEITLSNSALSGQTIDENVKGVQMPLETSPIDHRCISSREHQSPAQWTSRSLSELAGAGNNRSSREKTHFSRRSSYQACHKTDSGSDTTSVTVSDERSATVKSTEKPPRQFLVEVGRRKTEPSIYRPLANPGPLIGQYTVNWRNSWGVRAEPAPSDSRIPSGQQLGASSSISTPLSDTCRKNQPVTERQEEDTSKLPQDHLEHQVPEIPVESPIHQAKQSEPFSRTDAGKPADFKLPPDYSGIQGVKRKRRVRTQLKPRKVFVQESRRASRSVRNTPDYARATRKRIASRGCDCRVYIRKPYAREQRRFLRHRAEHLYTTDYRTDRPGSEIPDPETLNQWIRTSRPPYQLKKDRIPVQDRQPEWENPTMHPQTGPASERFGDPTADKSYSPRCSFGPALREMAYEKLEAVHQPNDCDMAEASISSVPMDRAHATPPVIYPETAESGHGTLNAVYSSSSAFEGNHEYPGPHDHELGHRAEHDKEMTGESYSDGATDGRSPVVSATMSDIEPGTTESEAHSFVPPPTTNQSSLPLNIPEERKPIPPSHMTHGGLITGESVDTRETDFNGRLCHSTPSVEFNGEEAGTATEPPLDRMSPLLTPRRSTPQSEQQIGISILDNGTVTQDISHPPISKSNSASTGSRQFLARAHVLKRNSAAQPSLNDEPLATRTHRPSVQKRPYIYEADPVASNGRPFWIHTTANVLDCSGSTPTVDHSFKSQNLPGYISPADNQWLQSHNKRRIVRTELLEQLIMQRDGSGYISVKRDQRDEYGFKIPDESQLRRKLHSTKKHPEIDLSTGGPPKGYEKTESLIPRDIELNPSSKDCSSACAGQVNVNIQDQAEEKRANNRLDPGSPSVSNATCGREPGLPTNLPQIRMEIPFKTYPTNCTEKTNHRDENISLYKHAETLFRSNSNDKSRLRSNRTTEKQSRSDALNQKYRVIKNAKPQIVHCSSGRMNWDRNVTYLVELHGKTIKKITNISSTKQIRPFVRSVSKQGIVGFFNKNLQHVRVEDAPYAAEEGVLIVQYSLHDTDSNDSLRRKIKKEITKQKQSLKQMPAKYERWTSRGLAHRRHSSRVWLKSKGSSSKD